MTTINAAENPHLVNKMVSEMLDDSHEESVEVVPTELPDTVVTLSGGYVNPKGEVIRESEVRELNGEDEEYISKTQGTGKFLSAILQRGVVRVGEEKPTAALLDSLLSGDRDDLLLGIRRATFGNTLEVSVTCQHCNEDQDVEIDLTTDVPRRVMDDPRDRFFSLDLKSGRVQVALPTGHAQKKILDAIDKTNAELNTVLLESCVQEINGMPVTGPGPVRSLSIRDREKIIAEISSRVTGPRLGDIVKPCAACEQEMNLPFAMAALFRL